MQGGGCESGTPSIVIFLIHKIYEYQQSNIVG